MADQAGLVRGRNSWREEVLREADRVRIDLDRSEFGSDAPERRYILANLEIARDAATRSHRGIMRVRSWWTGVDTESAWRAIHGAKQVLFDGMKDPDVRAQYPVLRSKVQQYLEAKDPERSAYEGWLKQGDDVKEPFDRARLRTVRTAVDGTSDAHYDKIHRFRNTLYLVFLGVIILDIVLIFDPPTDTWLPICAPAATAGEDPSCPLVWHIELVGLIGGVLAAAAALLKIPVSHEPYNLKRAQTLVKLPLSALTALVGVMLVQSDVLDVFEPQPTPTILMYAVIFGYSQELVTRLIDRKAESLVTPDEGPSVPA